MSGINGTVVQGDPDYDGRVILYIIKGEINPLLRLLLTLYKLTRPRT